MDENPGSYLAVEKLYFYDLIITMKIIDAHSHIDYISHEYQNDVVGTVCCATCESEWQKLVEMMSGDKNIWGAFGIHPWFADAVADGFEKRLSLLLQSDDSFMVGEIGLDKYKPNMEKQIEVFVKQLDIAIRFRRTVFLHCVGAWDKILHILKQYKKSELPIIVAHDFNGSIEIMNNLIKNYDILFSIHKIDKDHEINRIARIPSDKILVESDGNKDVCLGAIVNKISGVKNESDIGDIIYKNTLRILNNGQITSD